MCSVGNTTAASISSALCCGLIEIDGGRVGAVLGLAVDRIDEILVDEIFRRELEALGVGAFPGRRAQIAGGHFAFAGIELGDLAELQRIALAGIAVEIVEDAAAHADDLRIAARLAESEIVDGAVRHQHDRVGLRCMRAAGAGTARAKINVQARTSDARCEAFKPQP